MGESRVKARWIDDEGYGRPVSDRVFCFLNSEFSIGSLFKLE